jgi:hypothetical protein
MTDWREELIEKMAFMMFAYVEEQSRLRFGDIARAALAVAEPVIREQADNALREENARLSSEATLLRELLDDVWAQWDGDWPEELVARVKATIDWNKGRNCVPEGGKDD